MAKDKQQPEVKVKVKDKLDVANFTDNLELAQARAGK